MVDIQLIREANHYIYIGESRNLRWEESETDFAFRESILVSGFMGSGGVNLTYTSISNTGPNQGPVENQIAGALAERIISAAKDGEKFKVGEGRCV
jgi:hypothetical protein